MYRWNDCFISFQNLIYYFQPNTYAADASGRQSDSGKDMPSEANSNCHSAESRGIEFLFNFAKFSLSRFADDVCDGTPSRLLAEIAKWPQRDLL